MSGGILWREDWPVAPQPDMRGAAIAWIGEAASVETRIAAVAPTDADHRDAARHPAAARPDFLRRRRCLRRFIGDVLDRPPAEVGVAYDAGGAPRLAADIGLFLSASARGDRIAFAIARGPVGIDIETVAPPHEPAWSVLAEPERVWLQAQAPEARWAAFLVLWTAKEAYLKALGLGLRREPSDVAVAGESRALRIADRGCAINVRAAESRLFAKSGGDLRATCLVLR